MRVDRRGGACLGPGAVRASGRLGVTPNCDQDGPRDCVRFAPTGIGPYPSRVPT